MNKRDQLLVLNILDYLAVGGENPALGAQATKQFRQLILGPSEASEPQLSVEQIELAAENQALKAQVLQLEQQIKVMTQQRINNQEAFEAQQEMVQMTVNYMSDLLANTNGENVRLEDYLGKMRRQDRIVQEQVEAYLQMFQMTIDYMDRQSKAMEEEMANLRQSHQVAQNDEMATLRSQAQLSRDAMSVASASQAHFNPVPRLKSMFADALYVAHPEFTNGNVFCVTEKLGIIYLAMVKTSYTGLHGETFALVSNFYLQNIISNQKYINSSRLIEKYSEFVASMSEHTQAISPADIQVAVCLVDNQNCEVEFSTTGFPIYTLSNGAISEYHGGLASSGATNLSQPNNYKVKKLHLRKGSYLVLSSESFDARYMATQGNEVRELGQVVLEACMGPGNAQPARLIDFLNHYQLEKLNNSDLLIAGVKF